MDTKKYMADLMVTDNIHLYSNYHLIKLSQKDPLPDILPGQFAQVRVDNSPKTFLRRPISINYVDKKENKLWLLIQIVGDGTHKISEIKPGEYLNLLYPLGNSFSIPEANTLQNEKLLLIGGGVGIAPLLILGKNLRESGFSPVFLLGARTENDLLLIDEFQKFGKVYTTTEDGLSGEKGYVTNHSILHTTKFDRIYTCGPQPMMHAVAAYAKKMKITCEVSLENTMACGIGACLCCVENTINGHMCTCIEGPVFNIEKLKW